MSDEHALSHARFRHSATEAANRAEATALLIRCGYRVYRPEADIEGEDLVIRTPAGAFVGVQLKSAAMVDLRRYGNRGLLLLFPSALFSPEAPRQWFMIPHDELYAWIKDHHGAAPKWDDHWRYPALTKNLAAYLAPFVVRPPAEPMPSVDPSPIPDPDVLHA